MLHTTPTKPWLKTYKSSLHQTQGGSVTYSLLSDAGSEVITRLGLLNKHVEQQQAYYDMPVRDRHRGLPYPGTFMLDGSGMVVDKQFEQSYRVRPTGSALLEDVLGRPATDAELSARTR